MMPIFTNSDLKSDERTTGSRTISPSAKATPACAPNWASRLSMSCRNVEAVSRVGTADASDGANWLRWQASAARFVS